MNEKDFHENNIKCKKLNDILQIVPYEHLFSKEYVVVTTAGICCDFTSDCTPTYITGEICFIKFNFQRGITKKLTLFPDIMADIPVGYRDIVYEDLESNIGWAPNTFRFSNSVDECIEEINSFFGECHEPIFVPTKKNKKAVVLCLKSLYSRSKFSCPWKTNFKIYRFEYLVNLLLNKSLETSKKEDVRVLVILDYWKKLNYDIAPESCERHVKFGTPKQCATNVLLKYIYSTFLMVKSPEMSNVCDLVSSEFFDEMESIMSMEVPKSVSDSKVVDLFETGNVEDVITNIRGITIQHESRPCFNNKMRYLGRGRGTNLWNKK